jgi:DNA polymerase III delta prime subunit
MNTPLYLNDFIIHKDIANKLSSFTEYVPHMVFFGPYSSGKKTLMYAMINNIHNNHIPVQKYKIIKFDDITINGNLIPINYIQSPYHLEFNLSEFGLCDTDVIIHYINKIIQYKTIDNSLRIIILHHLDRLSNDTRKTLLSLMDNYIQTTRFFFICNNIQSLDKYFCSRIVKIRIPFPDKQSIYKHIKYSLPQLHNIQIDKIIEKTNCNLFNIYNLLIFAKQAIDTNPNSILSDTKLSEILSIPTIETIIHQLVPLIHEKNIASIKNIRSILYDFILSNIKITDIYNYITNYVMKHPSIPVSSKQSFLQDTNKYETNLINVEYNIIIIELLIFKVKKLFHQHNV